MGNSNKTSGFTLAEVLITLGIIGVVAALTIPMLLTKCQEQIIKNQLKKQYSVIQQALKIVDNELDYTPSCYYWTKIPYGPTTCTKRNEAGECTNITLADGSKLPDDYNGNMNDCALVKEKMKTVLKVATICEDNAVEKGCIPKYKGIDTIVKEQNNYSDKEATSATSGCRGWREQNIHKNVEAWVLMDGTIIFFYGTNPANSFQIFAIDLNGAKGPNKWGYDLFAFQSKGDGTAPAKLVAGGCFFPEKGGMSSAQLLQSMFSK